MKVNQNKLNRLLAFILSLSLLFSLLPIQTFATDDMVDSNESTVIEPGTYTFDENGNLICSVCGQTGTHAEDCEGIIDVEPPETTESTEVTCSCNTETDIHEETCGLYVKPVCDCGYENEVHLETCPLYEEPEETEQPIDTIESTDPTSPSCTCETETETHSAECPLYVKVNVCEECSGEDGAHTEECSQFKESESEETPTTPVEEPEDEEPAEQIEETQPQPEDNPIAEIADEPTLAESMLAAPSLDNLITALTSSSGLDVLTTDEITSILAHAQDINDDNVKLRYISVLLYALPNAPAATAVMFDLSAGNIEITEATYSGYYFYNGTKVLVTGKHVSATNYYVYQSNNGDVNQTYDEYGIPVYDRVTHNGTAWGTYVTNNIDIAGVVANWTTDAENVGRTSTSYHINVTGNGVYNLTVDNIWSIFSNPGTGRASSGIYYHGKYGNLTVTLKGDNRVSALHTSGESGSYLVIESTGSSTGTLTAASYDGKSNHYNAVIGGNDNKESNSYITINGGIIYAGAQTGDNCTGIGGGGNGYGEVKINGGTVTSVVNTSGAAIGGGIGESNVGGNAKITITGGKVYAYNYGYVSNFSGESRLITGAAIGGGSSCKDRGNASTVIDISGGYVYAQSLGGAAIGGGSSTMKAGGEATVTISGTAVVEAQSVGGTATNGEIITPGVSIGGGTGGVAGKGNGGDITLNIHGGTLYTGSIGGGNCTNDIGTIGSGTVTITGGTIRGQIVMGAGSTEKNIFIMSGGTINNALTPVINSSYNFEFVEEFGGAVYLEYGDATISGGTIKNCSSENGGAVYVVGGDFYMNGGTITNCTSQNGGAVHVNTGNFTMTNGTVYNTSATDGGAVYVNDGYFTMSGGDFHSNYATNGGAVYINDGSFAMADGKFYSNEATNGGAVYVNGGNFELSNGEFYDNTADYGGAVYTSGGSFTIRGGEFSENIATDGGAAFVSGGSIEIHNGTFDNNEAKRNGGAIYVNTDSVDVNINVYDGVITNNTSGNHAGAIGAQASGNYAINLNIGLEDCKGANCTLHDDGTCPVIQNNTTSRLGGAFCLHGDAQKLFVNIYCGDITDNISIRNSGSNTLNQGGGHVIVWGGNISPGIMVGGGIYDDNRVTEDQIYIRFWANYDGGPADPVIVEVTYGITMVFPVDTYEWVGHELSGWATAPDATGLYVPANGQYSITYTNDGYLDFYAAWDAVTSYVVYIPDTLPIETETQRGEMDISATLNYFKANSTLNIYVNSDFTLTNLSNTHTLLYELSSNEFGEYNIIGNGGTIATFQYNNYLDKRLIAKLKKNQALKYSDIFTDVITFTVEYAEIEDE